MEQFEIFLPQRPDKGDELSIPKFLNPEYEGQRKKVKATVCIHSSLSFHNFCMSGNPNTWTLPIRNLSCTHAFFARIRCTGVFAWVQPLLHHQIAGHTEDNGIVAFHASFFHIYRKPRNYIGGTFPVAAHSNRNSSCFVCSGLSRFLRSLSATQINRETHEE